MANEQQEAPAIYWRIDEWFPDLSPDIKTRLKAYHEELLKFNRTVSLISSKTVFMADALHFADCISASIIIAGAFPQMTELYDVGSGNGFPGLVYAIFNPKVKVILVDTDQRKCEFLRHMVNVLDAKNVTVENKSIEAFPADSIKFAVVRGFSSISKTILVMRKLMPKGGVLLHMKGEEWGIEVSEIPTQLCSLWSPSLVGEYKLPVGAVKFSVIKTDKIG